MASKAHPTVVHIEPAPVDTGAGFVVPPADHDAAVSDGGGARRSYGTLVVLLFVGAILLGRWKAFLRDWVPVVMLIFGYEFMRGIAGQMVNDQIRGEGRSVVHVQELIDADRAMFGGTLPTHWLQDRFYV